MQGQTGTTPRARMQQRLRYLYGAGCGDAAYADLTRLLDGVPARPPARATGTTFTEEDVVLITYGDTFLPATPPQPSPPYHGPLRGANIGFADIPSSPRPSEGEGR